MAKKSRRRWVQAAAVPAILVTAAACSSGDDQSSAPSPESPAPTVAESPEPDATRQQRDAASEEDLPPGLARKEGESEGPPKGKGPRGGEDQGPDPDSWFGEEGAFQAGSGAFKKAPPPAAFTCQGPGISPGVHWRGLPDGTAAIGIVLVDETATAGEQLLWHVTNVDPDINGIEGDELPEGATVGMNDFGEEAYAPPCPPEDEPHRFVLSLFALTSEMEPPSSGGDVRDAYAANAAGQVDIVLEFALNDEREEDD